MKNLTLAVRNWTGRISAFTLHAIAAIALLAFFYNNGTYRNVAADYLYKNSTEIAEANVLQRGITKVTMELFSGILDITETEKYLRDKDISPEEFRNILNGQSDVNRFTQWRVKRFLAKDFARITEENKKR